MLRFMYFLMFFLLASISPLQLGSLWRYHGAPGALLCMLRGVPAAPFEHSLAKEARRYATFCEHRGQVRDFLKSFCFFRINFTNKPEFWRASSSPRQSGLFGRSHGASGCCRSAPGMLLDAFRAAPAAPSEHSLVKEARRYATSCKNCCQVCNSLKYFFFTG